MQASTSQQYRNILSVLPPEIIVQILSYTDACSIGRFSASSSSCKGLVDQNSHIIYEAIANRLFNVTIPCTAGDSGITIDSLPSFALEELEQSEAGAQVAPTERQLRKAIKYQRTSSTVYDNLKTWRDFGELSLLDHQTCCIPLTLIHVSLIHKYVVKKRTLVDHAWKYERPSRYTVARCPGFDVVIFGFWRFKICSFSRRVIASTPGESTSLPSPHSKTTILFLRLHTVLHVNGQADY